MLSNLAMPLRYQASVRSGAGRNAGRMLLPSQCVLVLVTGPPQQHGADAEAAARRRRRQMHLPPPLPAQQLLPPAQQPPQQQQRRRRQPLPEHLAAAAIAAAIPAGEQGICSACNRCILSVLRQRPDLATPSLLEVGIDGCLQTCACKAMF